MDSEYMDKIRGQWRDFSNTDAYKDFIQYMKDLKDIAIIGAQGPLEPYADITTSDGTKQEVLQFEPEKLAYLLQRSVGYDIIRIYVEELVSN